MIYKMDTVKGNHHVQQACFLMENSVNLVQLTVENAHLKMFVRPVSTGSSLKAYNFMGRKHLFVHKFVEMEKGLKSIVMMEI